MAKEYDRITTHTSLWEDFLDHAILAGLVAQAHVLHARGMLRLRRWPDTMLLLAVAPETRRVTRSQVKSKPNEDVSVASGN